MQRFSSLREATPVSVTKGVGWTGTSLAIVVLVAVFLFGASGGAADATQRAALPPGIMVLAIWRGFGKWSQPYLRAALARLKATGRAVVVFLGLMTAPPLAWLGSGLIATELWPENDWAYRWRYTYGIDSALRGAEVVLDKRPHDCDFLTAPVGSKRCRYERRIATVRVKRMRSGLPLASFDEGRSWSGVEGSTQPAVFISWGRIDD